MATWLVVGNLVGLWIAVACLGLLVIALARRLDKVTVSIGTKRSDLGMLESGEIVPAFEAIDLQGHVVTKAAYEGEHTVLVFISPTCKPCLEKLPAIRTALPSARKEGIGFVLVSLADLASTAALAKEHDLADPGLVLVALRETNPMMADLSIPGTPSYVFMDPSGLVLEAGVLGQPFERHLAMWRDQLNSGGVETDPRVAMAGS